MGGGGALLPMQARVPKKQEVVRTPLANTWCRQYAPVIRTCEYLCFVAALIQESIRSSVVFGTRCRADEHGVQGSACARCNRSRVGTIRMHDGYGAIVVYSHFFTRYFRV